VPKRGVDGAQILSIMNRNESGVIQWIEEFIKGVKELQDSMDFMTLQELFKPLFGKCRTRDEVKRGKTKKWKWR
jgi:hypothetical protein